MVSTYYLTDKALGWNAAQAQAEALGGNLVAINSAEENQLLIDAFGGNFWIGLSDAEEEGNWSQWVNGEPVTYTNWAGGEPNNIGNEDYAAFNGGNWNDLSGSNKLLGIIEVNELTKVSISSSQFIEQDDTSALFLVSLSAATNVEVTIDYTTVDGTALAGKDYTATNGTLTFAPGETSKVISVPIIKNNQVEASETFSIKLSNPSNATLSQNTATTTILDGYTNYYLTSVSSWKNAQATAESWGGNLVTINSAEENQLLVDTFGDSERLWIGLTDEAQEGNWSQWISGEPVTYTNWNPGEPNNFDGNEDYAHLLENTSGLWNDIAGSERYRGIVEVKNTIVGSEQKDQLTGTIYYETIQGLGGNDNIKGLNGDDTLLGNGGNDILDGGNGSDNMIGGLGDDTYFVQQVSDIVTELEDEGIDLIQSSVNYTLPAHVETLMLLGDQNINGIGNELANTLMGNTGNNLLDGKAGDDFMEGGTGDDIYFVDSANDQVVEQKDQGVDTVNSTINYTLGDTVENLNIIGQGNRNGIGNAFDNAITGNNGRNRLEGLEGDDTLDGKGGVDTLDGGLGDDVYFVNQANDKVIEALDQGIDTVNASVTYTLAENVENLTLTRLDNIDGMGNTLNNVIKGNDGNNLLDGKEGLDTLEGSLGDDTYILDRVGDRIKESADAGIDTVIASFNYTLGNNLENLNLTGTSKINGVGNDLDNNLTGNSRNNRLTGLKGNDSLNGAEGQDTMVGNIGDDSYWIDNLGDSVIEKADEGIETVYASIDYTLSDHVENLFLTDAAINGIGNSLDNMIMGNDLANSLMGMEGDDILTGGLGQDNFVFSTPTEGIDTIQDFTPGEDMIEILSSGFGTLPLGELSSTRFVLGTSAGDLNDRFIYDQGTGSLYFDGDGTGSQAKVQLATLTNQPLLSASDIFII